MFSGLQIPLTIMRLVHYLANLLGFKIVSINGVSITASDGYRPYYSDE